MRYWTCTIAGLGLCAAGLAGVNWGIYELVQIGTCASGGPYVPARQCPDGTGLKIVALVGGVFAGLIGVAVHAMRTDAPRRGWIGLGGVMWSLLFLGLATSALLGTFGPGAEDAPGSELGVVIMAAVFIPMGIVPLVLAFLTRDKGEEQPLIAPFQADAPNVLAPQPVWATRPASAPPPEPGQDPGGG